MEFFGSFNQPCILPASLKKITFSVDNYSHPLSLPTGIKEMFWGPRGVCALVLPECLEKLTWASESSVALPLGLRELVVTGRAPLILPEGLTKVEFGLSTDCHYVLPESVQEVVWLAGARESIFSHPTTLQHLILKLCMREIDLSHNKIHKLTIEDPNIKIGMWPRELKELAINVYRIKHPMRVPKGVRIVGEHGPTSAIRKYTSFFNS